MEPEGSLPCSQEPSTVVYLEPDQSSLSHPTSLSSNLVLSTHLRLRLPSGLFSSGFPTNILYAFLVSPIRATWPAHLILLVLIILIILGQEYKLCSSRINVNLNYASKKKQTGRAVFKDTLICSVSAEGTMQFPVMYRSADVYASLCVSITALVTLWFGTVQSAEWRFRLGGTTSRNPCPGVGDVVGSDLKRLTLSTPSGAEIQRY
jgi:hypothetical protein